MFDPLDTEKSILIFAYGNPSRGDDALGPELLQRLESKIHKSELQERIELLSDFQLQIEHTLDMENRQQVIFVDASVKPGGSFNFAPLQSEKDNSYTSHAMSPASLLSLHEQLHPGNKPEVFLLAIRGYEFELGHSLSIDAESNLQQALDYLYNWLCQQTGHLDQAE